MEGQQIPRATMTNFIKNKLQYKVSGQFTDSILALAKQFIFNLTDKANQVCEEKNKKTINSDHLYLALKALNMEDHVEHLKQSEKDLIHDNKLKQEYRQRVQDNLDLIMKKSSSMMQDQPPAIQIKDSFEPMQEKADEEIDDDYEAEMIETGNKGKTSKFISPSKVQLIEDDSDN